MNEFAGRTALVTGAGSGIGRALALESARAGMDVVAVDVDAQELSSVGDEVGALGGRVATFATDVSDRDQVASLADEVDRMFDGVDLLCNNAGVGMRGLAWERTYDDWDWVLGVNLGGVVHGIHEFVPRMLATGRPGHVVNTASIAGLISAPRSAVYTTSKYAVVGLSESLAHDLAAIGAKVGVSVLCPGWVRTRIVDSERNRPAHPDPEPDAPESDAPESDAPEPDAPEPDALVSDEEIELEARTRAGIDAGIDPARVAARVFRAVRNEEFWIVTHDYSAAIEQRMDEVLAARP